MKSKSVVFSILALAISTLNVLPSHADDECKCKVPDRCTIGQASGYPAIFINEKYFQNYGSLEGAIVGLDELQDAGVCRKAAPVSCRIGQSSGYPAVFINDEFFQQYGSVEGAIRGLHELQGAEICEKGC